MTLTVEAQGPFMFIFIQYAKCSILSCLQAVSMLMSLPQTVTETETVELKSLLRGPNRDGAGHRLCGL